MVWTIEYSPIAKAQLKRLDKTVARRIADFMEKRIAVRGNPRTVGSALEGKVFGSLWKYRVGDYRIISEIQDSALTILAVRIGNRRDVYKSRK